MLMLNTRSDQKGSLFVWLILIGVVVIWGMSWLASQHQDAITDTITPVASIEQSASEDIQEAITKSFVSVNGYNAGGKAVITEDDFGYFSMRASLTLPSEFPRTNYYAVIKGAGNNPDTQIGKLSKTGGVFSFEFDSPKPINYYSKVVIYVDGDAATVEGKTLPHNVVEMDF